MPAEITVSVTNNNTNFIFHKVARITYVKWNIIILRQIHSG